VEALVDTTLAEDVLLDGSSDVQLFQLQRVIAELAAPLGRRHNLEIGRQRLKRSKVGPCLGKKYLHHAIVMLVVFLDFLHEGLKVTKLLPGGVKNWAIRDVHLG
jgi:hypothetical protein